MFWGKRVNECTDKINRAHCAPDYFGVGSALSDHRVLLQQRISMRS